MAPQADRDPRDAGVQPSLDRTTRERAEQEAHALRRLLSVTAALADAVDASSVVDVLLREGRSALEADAAAMFLFADADAALEIEASVGYPDEAVRLLRSVALHAPLPVAEAFRERRSVWVGSREELRARFPQQEPIARAVGGAALVAVPLIAAGSPLGAAVFQFLEPRPYDEGEQDLLVAIARQCAQALARARLLEQERRARRSAERVADVLQRSLLPPALPAIPGIDLAVRYRPAGDATQVGGDFYDAFETDGGFGVLLGDVSGKGAAAAAIVGIARYTLRTAALGEGPPSRILGVLNEALLRQTDDHRYCTVCYVRVRPGRGTARLTIACGGHPLPFLVRSEGDVAQVGRPGTLIGALPEPRLSDAPVELVPGDALVLYSDGVTEEARGGTAFGEQRLHGVLLGCVGLTAGEIATRVVRAVEEFRPERPRDDMAVLVLRVRGVTRRLAVAPTAAAEAREAVDALMGSVPGEVFETIRLLTSELVTNAVRHAGLDAEGSIELRACVLGDAVRVEVRDEGPGFDVAPTRPDEREDGWGLFLVQRAADRWGVDRREDVTCAWFELDLARDTAVPAAGGSTPDRS